MKFINKTHHACQNIIEKEPYPRKTGQKIKEQQC